jgi:hypothetical protein
MIPGKKDWGPILAGAGVFVVSTYVAIHQFILPRSEAEAAMMATNRRIDSVEMTQERDRKEYIERIEKIYSWMLEHK